MPGPELRTATRMPFASVCSVLISSSRGPASTAPIASFQHQIQDDLLQLNTIPLYGKQPLSKTGLDRDSDCASRQCDHLIDRLIKIKIVLPRRRFLDVVTNAGPTDPR